MRFHLSFNESSPEAWWVAAGEAVFEVLLETERVGVGPGAAKLGRQECCGRCPTGTGDAGVWMPLPLGEGCI